MALEGKQLHDLIIYRLERAQETYEEALMMQNSGHWNTCANRLYYSCYYAVSALLAKEGMASSKHTGIKAMFNQHYVKPGIVSKEDGKLYNSLFDARQEGDYIDFVKFQKEDVEPWVIEVKDFIENISLLVHAGKEVHNGYT